MNATWEIWVCNRDFIAYCYPDVLGGVHKIITIWVMSYYVGTNETGTWKIVNLGKQFFITQHVWTK